MAISQRFAPGLLTVFRLYFTRWYYWLEAFLAVLGLFYLFLRARGWLFFFLWPLLYLLSFVILGVSRYYWYYAPLVPGLIVLAGLGTTGISEWIRIKGYQPKNETIVFNNILYGLTAGIILLIFFSRADSISGAARWSDPRYSIYKDVGDWIRLNSSAKESVGTLEAGIIGFYADRPIIGFAGLILPEIAERLTPESTYAGSAAWAVEHYHPEYLVLQSGHFPGIETGYAAQYCQVARRFTGSDYGYGANIDIYSCRTK